ncbi:hypothetical protein V8G54_009613 [Vigna mungo]|uniref:Uncharacterized protein n=1 Tax=Vigna mungo TaxID=3915 RepID=A0AAQ3NUC2_VIGMU
MEGSVVGERSGRISLSEVVADCVKRWFKDALKEAKTGDINMQVLVSQMYYSGYGVPRDAQKGLLGLGMVLDFGGLKLTSNQTIRPCLLLSLLLRNSSNENSEHGRVWLTKASRTRSSVWKVGDKHPGYNASDSDSDELKEDS